jgi:hypothetical protein
MVHINTTMLNSTQETKQIEIINNHQKEVNKTNFIVVERIDNQW